jgi:hypothetical protein
VPLLHGGSSLCMRRPISCGIHPSVSGGVLMLDTGFLSALPVSTAACSLETARCSASDSTEVGSSHSRRASVASWQVIVSLRHAFREWIAASSLGTSRRSTTAPFLLDLEPSSMD